MTDNVTRLYGISPAIPTDAPQKVIEAQKEAVSHLLDAMSRAEHSRVILVLPDTNDIFYVGINVMEGVFFGHQIIRQCQDPDCLEEPA